MISAEEALAIAEKHFPQGPEVLAKVLGTNVLKDVPLEDACDGWFLRNGSVSLIRVNNKKSRPRQRFTLAHELAHLILGTKAKLHLSPFQSDDAEERRADALAANMLVPPKKLTELLTPPIEMDAIQRLAAKCDVSLTMMACHVAHHANSLGLKNGLVFTFDLNDHLLWKFSKTLKCEDDSDIVSILKETEASGSVIRKPNGNDIAVYSAKVTAHNKILFVQVLPKDLGNKSSITERAKELSEQLFGEDVSFRCSVTSQIGAFVHKLVEVGSNETTEEAVEAFLQRYQKFKDKRRVAIVCSELGREYVTLHINRQLREKRGSSRRTR